MANGLDPHVAIATTATRLIDEATANDRPLMRALARSQAPAGCRAFPLVLPLLAFILITFVIPIGQMLQRSCYNDGFRDLRASAALERSGRTTGLHCSSSAKQLK